MLEFDQLSTGSSSQGIDSGKHDPLQKFNFPDPKCHKVKTEMCKFWLQQSVCPFQFNCLFAHGQDELHTRIDLPNNYRTKECTNFSGAGHCQYGNRCQFKHIYRHKKNLPNLKFTTSLLKIDEASLTKKKRIQRLPIFQKICPKQR